MSKYVPTEEIIEFAERGGLPYIESFHRSSLSDMEESTME